MLSSAKMGVIGSKVRSESGALILTGNSSNIINCYHLSHIKYILT